MPQFLVIDRNQMLAVYSVRERSILTKAKSFLPSNRSMRSPAGAVVVAEPAVAYCEDVLNQSPLSQVHSFTYTVRPSCGRVATVNEMLVPRNSLTRSSPS